MGKDKVHKLSIPRSRDISAPAQSLPNERPHTVGALTKVEAASGRLISKAKIDYCTLYKELRSAVGPRRPLRSLRKEKVHDIIRSGQRSMIEYIFSNDCSCKLAA